MVFLATLVSAAFVLASGDVGTLLVTNLIDAIRTDLPEGHDSFRFSISGQVVAFEDNTIHVRDGNEGTPVRQPPNCTNLHATIGDIVQIDGQGHDNALNRRVLQADTISVIGYRALPEPVEIDHAALSSGRHRYQLVRMQGVVAAAFRDELDSRWNWFLLCTPDGSVNVACMEAHYPLESLKSLSDANIEATGMAMQLTNWRARLGNHLQLCSSNAISVIRPAPTDPFRVPNLQDGPSAHRRCVSGHVLAATKEFLFLKSPRRALIRIRLSDGSAPPPAGSQVEVSGFPVRTAGGLLLFDAVIRPAHRPTAETSEPIDINPKTLFENPEGIDRISSLHNGQIIRLRGTVRTMPGLGNEQFAFMIDSCSRLFSVDMSAHHEACNGTPAAGSQVEVTGLCVADFQDDALRMGFPHFKGFVIVPRTSSDIKILANPPWWTPLRLFVFICILIVALIAIAIWNRLLHAHAERRGRELYHERIAHAQAEFKVEERTRLAVELHDSVSQTLAGVALQIDSADRASRTHGDTGCFLGTARQLLASCRRELQSCLWDLRSRTFEERDMTEAIERAVSPHTGSAKVSVRFNVPREQLLETTTHDILRIIRELVSNAVRHGHASSVRIAGEHHGDTVSFSVSDDGCGFDIRETPGPLQGHFGLQGIRERLKPYKGSIDIESAPGKGTRAAVRMVISEMNEDEEED